MLNNITPPGLRPFKYGNVFIKIAANKKCHAFCAVPPRAFFCLLFILFLACKKICT
ncbi:hypothetical protein HMPREF1613_04291 [Escherichia coli 908616]|nr:hypothetical protein HMPREF9553_04566 [Escherichia coli MS 200-1]EFJ91030.1 hypothetical protein HMPREF9531_03930 [Escherichia coli MS 45-1]EFU47361.1 hypothetical protein HMPREF9539_02098 [Escherichia coli MS 110-3]EGB85044.1 hypothetical protein HMPREF9533_00123 [Escherichia coli MS 60-1]ESD38008.1 hypothetical protein HMPREF1603_02437 [Escherichia coli 907892]ESD44610.1 hypothetical protein HMPREF1604_00872 [Escherichia coli 908519]ESD83974.1 hypothetical protein HMPREF1613_04291 [Esche